MSGSSSLSRSRPGISHFSKEPVMAAECPGHPSLHPSIQLLTLMAHSCPFFTALPWATPSFLTPSLSRSPEPVTNSGGGQKAGFQLRWTLCIGSLEPMQDQAEPAPAKPASDFAPTRPASLVPLLTLPLNTSLMPQHPSQAVPKEPDPRHSLGLFP